MKVKITVEMELDIPDSFKTKTDNQVVEFLDQDLRNQLYVGTSYCLDDSYEYAQASEMTIRSYFNLDRKYDDTDYKLC